MTPVCLHACKSRERQNSNLQIHLCCTVFRRDIELGQLHSRLASRRKFHRFHLQRRAGDRRKDGAADTCLTCCRYRWKVHAILRSAGLNLTVSSTKILSEYGHSSSPPRRGKDRRASKRKHILRRLDFLRSAGCCGHGSIGGRSKPGYFCHQCLTGWLY